MLIFKMVTHGGSGGQGSELLLAEVATFGSVFLAHGKVSPDSAGAFSFASGQLRCMATSVIGLAFSGRAIVADGIVSVLHEKETAQRIKSTNDSFTRFDGPLLKVRFRSGRISRSPGW